MKISTLVLAARVIFSVATWLLVMAIRLLLLVLGYPLIAWQSAYLAIDELGKLHFRARWMWVYDNLEDGVDGRRGGDPAQDWWMRRTKNRTLRERVFLWSAIRNPVNNLRYVPVLCPRFHPEQIAFRGTGDEPPNGQSGWAYTWQGIYSGFYFKTPHVWCWIGWKFRPSDRAGINPMDTRLPRCDFATQLQLIRGKT